MSGTGRETAAAERMQRHLRRRRRRERWFRGASLLATSVGVIFLAVFLTTVIAQASSAFQQTYIRLTVDLDDRYFGAGGQAGIDAADYDAVVRDSLWARFPDVSSRTERRALNRLISIGAAYEIRTLVEQNPEFVGTVQSVFVPAAANVDMLVKGEIDRAVPESQRPLSDRQLDWLDSLSAAGDVETRFNRNLFVNGDSREPELAGILGALTGSFLMMVVTVALSFPLGIATAIYLEEFAPRSRLTDIIEVNINNLAAVPSIIFGLLGLAFFIDELGMPRSAPLVGGLVLSLLTLPIIIISSRAALAAVPDSIRLGALALGASRLQVVADHLLPQAMPGILTGGIIGLSRALGESAPLLMIGMVAFIVDVPEKLTDPATALPVQIYLWADSPERAFAERTAAAIVVLLAFLLLMNLAAVIMRRRLQDRTRA